VKIGVPISASLIDFFVQPLEGPKSGTHAQQFLKSSSYGGYLHKKL